MRVLITLISLFVCAIAVNSNNCNLKPMDHDVDWSRLSGTRWYQMLNVRDPFVRVTPCYLIHLGSTTETGIHLEFVSLTPSNPENAQTTSQEFYKDGDAYRFRMENKKAWMETLKQTFGDPDLAAGDNEDLDDHFKYPVYIYTDYTNYLMGILCREGGHYYYAYSSHNGISAEVTAEIYNTMIEHDPTPAPLYFSQCPEIQDVEQYF